MVGYHGLSSRRSATASQGSSKAPSTPARPARGQVGHGCVGCDEQVHACHDRRRVFERASIDVQPAAQLRHLELPGDLRQLLDTVVLLDAEKPYAWYPGQRLEEAQR